jgi:ATP-dependent DNA ligase
VRADEASVDAADVQFDVLSVDGEPVVSRPYSERRRILEELQLNDARWRTPQAFDDGEALWAAVCEHELEGVVAKRRSGRYVSGGRGWIKTKNRDYWRYEMEREGALKTKREVGSSECVTTRSEP